MGIVAVSRWLEAITCANSGMQLGMLAENVSGREEQ